MTSPATQDAYRQRFIFPDDEAISPADYYAATHQGYNASAATIIGAIKGFTGYDDAETIEHQNRAWTAHGILDHLLDSSNPANNEIWKDYLESLSNPGHTAQPSNDPNIDNALKLYRNSFRALNPNLADIVISNTIDLAHIGQVKRQARDINEYSSALFQESLAASNIIGASVSERVIQDSNYGDFRRWLFLTALMSINADSAYDMKQDFAAGEIKIASSLRNRLILGKQAMAACKDMLLSSDGAPRATAYGLHYRRRYGKRPSNWRQKIE